MKTLKAIFVICLLTATICVFSGENYNGTADWSKPQYKCDECGAYTGSGPIHFRGTITKYLCWPSKPILESQSPPHNHDEDNLMLTSGLCDITRIHGGTKTCSIHTICKCNLYYSKAHNYLYALMIS